ncbi:SDR family NAD(P)-dependent oxidoreductase [Streptodolium elevatio]|uniref:SDR family NAD(P)-dependent oxidoreductase n=1 Tax=Streptodolium elevatio TaxID=3157996 RepID=A0ABV3DPY2_9ACTN
MDPLRFDNRVAVVTGAGRNLGRVYALALAERGARVVVNDLGVAISDTDGSGDGPAENPAVAVVREIEALGGEAVVSTDSVATEEGGAAIVDTAVEAFGRVDIVVNNAGVVRTAPFADLPPELVDPVLATQIASVFHVTRPAWRLMAAQGYGRIVNVSSGSAFAGVPGLSAYGGAKAGVIGLTRQMATEGAGLGIKVNVIAPYAKTRPGTGFGPIPPSDELNAWMRPEFLTPLVNLLAHEECPVTGECFAAGAGYVSRVVWSTTEGLVDRNMTTETLLRDWEHVMDTDGMAVVGHDGGGTTHKMLVGFTPPQSPPTPKSSSA